WYGGLAQYNSYGGGEFLDGQSYKKLQRWTTPLGPRPPLQRGRMVDRLRGDPAPQRHEGPHAPDLGTQTPDNAPAPPAQRSRAPAHGPPAPPPPPPPAAW